MGSAKVIRCRRKDGDPTTKDKLKSSISSTNKEKLGGMVIDRHRNQARKSAVTTTVHHISRSSSGPSEEK